MNPFLILGVPPDADDQWIRQAYLEAIKVATPDTDPQRFRLISSAYEKIKDEASRNQFILFDRECPADTPWHAYLQYVRWCVKPQPLPFEAMKKYLRSCAKT